MSLNDLTKDLETPSGATASGTPGLTQEAIDIIDRLVRRLARNHFFPEHDADDIVQEVFLHILENDIPPTGYKDTIVKIVGRFRQIRDRERSRLTSLEQE